MNKIFKKTKDFIFTQQTSMLSSTLILAGMMILSRIGGFIRYRILGEYFSPDQLDIFYAAFRIPDLVFEILINGALSTTFIPFYIEYQKRKSEQNTVISSIINIVTLVLAGFIILLVILMPLLINIIAPGFDPEKTKILVMYSRILLIGQLPFLVLGNFLTAISQAKKSFLLPALAPIVYNIAIIVLIIFFSSSLHLMAPILGVVIGATLFFMIQIPVFTISQFRYKFVLGYFNEAWRFFRTAIPRILTIIVAEIDATIDLTLATLLGPGSYTIFYLAQRLQLLPVSVVGMAFGQASLPYLSDMYQEKRFKEFKNIIVDSILNMFFFMIPAAAFMIVTRTPMVRLFFGGGKFDWDATVMTALTFSYFALSLPLHAIYYFLTRCFYAVFDTKTPFYISAGSIALNAGLSILFTLFLKLPIWSLALSFSLTMSVRTILLLVVLHKKIGGYEILTLLKDTFKITVATFNTSILTYFLLRLLDGLILDTTRTINVFYLLTIGFIFFSTVYLFLSWLFGIKELYILTKMLVKVREYRNKILEVYQGVD
ncbi:murein biosynthesis integral membrane protein MurJ [Candidatus Roizmanbacteria bacterium CG_4_10_14_0_2_um_filter_36_9]|uniref:Probable lipid II flippase MurJ n=1 Tax=Candidatus Roizmanbacteria bacterium CG_4_10_14_0_2_um_filter_36_9 TaxID=1974823 RepID=A0A2M7U265_9BACT|nr:MAG: murein biosynthesis integral membrane protein MurJ [Candidatus Roizmanbacteria bacterium CG_4_10_14_0_2_um_filter_36_9]